MMTDYVTLACEYLGVTGGMVVGSKIHSDRVVVLIDFGIKGTKKYTIPLDELPAAPPTAQLDATAGALKLLARAGIAGHSIIEWLDKDKRLSVNDVRAYMREHGYDRD